jgi:hypothetical protein
MSQFNWQMLSAICATLMVAAGVFSGCVQLMLGHFQKELLKDLDERYASKSLDAQRHSEIDRRLLQLEQRTGLWRPLAREEEPGANGAD